MTRGYQIVIAKCYIKNLNVTPSTNMLKISLKEARQMTGLLKMSMPMKL
jgi:hypothetical protein